jgi:LysM repeat protein
MIGLQAFYLLPCASIQCEMTWHGNAAIVTIWPAFDIKLLSRRQRSIVESLKPLLLLLVLGGVGYGVYVALNHAPPPEFATLAPEWNKPAGSEPGSPTGTAGNRASDSTTMPSAPNMNSGSTVSSLPFGLGSNSVGPPIANTTPQNQQLPPSGNLPEAQSANLNAAPAGSFQAPNSGAPSSAPPNFGVSNSGTAVPTPSNQNVTNPAADAQARHDYEASTRTALTLLNQGQLVEALRELSRWYGQTAVPPSEEPRFVELLSQLAGTVIYSRDPWLGPPYQVRAGDSLESIAQQYQVPWQLLAKINGIPNASGLLPGQKLKIVHGPFQAQLNVQQGWLALFVDGLYAGRFRIQTSGQLMKPDGAYPVAKFSADKPEASNQSPFISLGGDLHLRVPEDALPPGVAAVRISRQDMSEVFDMLSERSQVTIVR